MCTVTVHINDVVIVEVVGSPERLRPIVAESE